MNDIMYETLQYYYRYSVSFPQSPSSVHIGRYTIIYYNPVSTRRENNISVLVCVMIILWVCENVRLFPGLEIEEKLLTFIVQNIIYKYYYIGQI